MPRGVPNSGYRKPRRVRNENGELVSRNHATISATKANAQSVGHHNNVFPLTIAQPTETDDQIDKRIAERFDILQIMSCAAITGEVRSIIVSGPPGLGKSYTIEQSLKDYDSNGDCWRIVKGYLRPTGLYKTLYQNRNKGNILVFDDADSIFNDDVSINFLKAVCDTTEKRVLSYLSEYVLVDDESAENIPKTFEFEGTIIFITNIDFDELINRGHKLAPHLSALVSRSHYIDLSMKNPRDYLVRIRQVIKSGMFENLDMTYQECEEVENFIEKNYLTLRELSLRMAIKLANLRKSSINWERIAKITCLRNGN